MSKKISVLDLVEMKKRKENISMLTAYDFPVAAALDEAEIDLLLVGDTMGMVVMGHPTTLPVVLNDTIRHTQAVARATKRAMVIGDLPFGTFGVSVEKTVENSVQLMKEGKAEAVKLEGGRERVAEIRSVTEIGIPVMGHLGLTPQSVFKFGGFKVQGRTQRAAQRIIEDAKMIEEAGVFSIVLECVPWPVSKKITEELSIPTIGIGAGPYCDGQVLVTYDLLGFFEGFTPRFVKKYTNLKEIIIKAAASYHKEVKKGAFPERKHSYEMPEDEVHGYNYSWESPVSVDKEKSES